MQDPPAEELPRRNHHHHQQQQPPPPPPPAHHNSDHRNDSLDPLYIHQLLHQLDTTPALTEEEICWCWEIKQAMATEEDLEDISDFEIAQMALVVPRGDAEEALYRIRGLQDFRQEYSIHDTVEEGMELLQGLFSLFPGYILDVAYLPLTPRHAVQQPSANDDNNADPNDDAVEEGGHFTIVFDYKCAKPHAVRMPDEWRKMLGGVYYHNQLLQAHLRCVREGVGYVVETQGMTFQNFDVDLCRQTWYHMAVFYPIKFKSVYYVHASIVGNMLHALCKSMMGPEIAGRIKVGCHSGLSDASTRLDELFHVPTREIAEAKLLKTCRVYLTVRYQNQKEFRLPQPRPTAPRMAQQEQPLGEQPSDDDDDDQ